MSITYSAILYYILYYSLSAGLLRQATYTTMRLGIFTSLMDMFAGLVYCLLASSAIVIYSSKDGEPPRFMVKAGLGE